MFADRTRPADGRARPTPPGRPRVRSPHARPVARRGVAALLAMVFLVLFAAMALGFYAQANMAGQVSGNERRAAEARVAAESGVTFMRYHLASVRIPPGYTRDQQFQEL